MSAATGVLPRDTDRVRAMVTPEGIALPLTLASRGSRAGALLLDFTFIGLLMIATTLALFYLAGGTMGLLAQASDPTPVGHALQFLFVLWVVAMFLFRNAYFLFFELGPRGATPGKRLAGIRIAARDGGRLTAEMVIARNLLRDIELFLPLVFVVSASSSDATVTDFAAAAWFLMFALFPFFNKDRLRAGDIIAGSWVVEAPRRKLEAALSAGQGSGGAAGDTKGAAYRFSEAELAIYGEYELQTLERVLRENRPEALAAVYETICRKLGRDAESVGDRRAFLETYYAQLRARLEANMRLGKRKADKFDEGGSP